MVNRLNLEVILQDVFVNGGRSALVVLNSAHVALAETLIKNKADLGSHLSAQEDSFLHAVTTLGRPRRGVDTAGAGSVAIAVVLEVGEILGELQSLDRGWGLGMAA